MGLGRGPEHGETGSALGDADGTQRPSPADVFDPGKQTGRVTGVHRSGNDQDLRATR